MPAMTVSEVRELLKAGNDAMIKRYYDYDVNGNLTDIYIAQTAAQAGDSCLRHRFEYILTSGGYNLSKDTWAITTWSGVSWDIV